MENKKPSIIKEILQMPLPYYGERNAYRRYLRWEMLKTQNAIHQYNTASLETITLDIPGQSTVSWDKKNGLVQFVTPFVDKPISIDDAKTNAVMNTVRDRALLYSVYGAIAFTIIQNIQNNF